MLITRFCVFLPLMVNGSTLRFPFFRLAIQQGEIKKSDQNVQTWRLRNPPRSIERGEVGNEKRTRWQGRGMFFIYKFFTKKNMNRFYQWTGRNWASAKLKRESYDSCERPLPGTRRICESRAFTNAMFWCRDKMAGEFFPLCVDIFKAAGTAGPTITRILTLVLLFRRYFVNAGQLRRFGRGWVDAIIMSVKNANACVFVCMSNFYDANFDSRGAFRALLPKSVNHPYRFHSRFLPWKRESRTVLNM